MNDFLFIAVAAAAALFVLMLKMNIRRVLGYDAAVDITSTALLVSMFNGTLGGMAAAVFAGCLLSILLLVAKCLLGYERLERDGLRLRWRFYPPRWRSHS